MYLKYYPSLVRRAARQCPRTTTKLFADDCLLYRKIQSQDDANKLQEDLDSLQKWESDWLMKFNSQKCQTISVTNKRNPLNMTYSIHDQPLQKVSSAKYLGVHIHQNMKWNHHISMVTKKANSTRAFLQRNLHSCPRSVQVLCYKSLLRPVLEYGCEMWDPFTKDNTRKLEMVQRRYARFTMGDHRRTSSVTDMLRQLQWPTLEERRAQFKVVMVYRLVNTIADVPKVQYFNQAATSTSLRELADWVQGNELPLRNQYWDEVGQVEEEGELDIMSPESNKRQYPGGKRQYPGGKRQYPGGKRQYPAGKRQYPAGKRQFVGGELIPSPELRQWPGGKRQWPGGKRQWPGGKRQWPGGKRQWPGGKRQWPEVKRQYPGGKRSESDQNLLTMELRQYPGGKRQWPGGKRQYPAGKRQYPGGKRQFPGGKRQFLGGEPLEQESNINKRFAPEDDTMDLVRLSQLYGTNNDVMTDERELALEDLLDEIMVDTRPEIDDSRDILLGNLDQDDALALDLSALLANGW
ncbi:uncharacterized protein LOC129258037 [Lytechinus pictus]|uniref:uncharacterized protein LOC129258037 n=1 Tax=Lytechinus pictus TaxID=7653 RepID=UPI00240D3C29|nr:uncharacterized protein LOC129258037 [Lytechinus pictus]